MYLIAGFNGFDECAINGDETPARGLTFLQPSTVTIAVIP
jgi:hypothetical protein